MSRNLFATVTCELIDITCRGNLVSIFILDVINKINGNQTVFNKQTVIQ